MAIILTKNGVEHTNIDGARSNYFNAGNKNGIVKGSFNEGQFFASSSNVITLDTCELIISGHRIIVDEQITHTITGTPISDTRYSFIAQVKVDDSSQVTFSTFIANDSQELIQDNLFANKTGSGTYQVKIGNFTHNTDGNISDVERLVKVIYGGSRGTENVILNVGDIETETLEADENANVVISQNYDVETDSIKTNFKFAIPKGKQGEKGEQGESVFLGYDLIIRTQEEFDEWLNYYYTHSYEHSVLLIANSNEYILPETGLNVNGLNKLTGLNNPTIRITGLDGVTSQTYIGSISGINFIIRTKENHVSTMLRNVDNINNCSFICYNYTNTDSTAIILEYCKNISNCSIKIPRTLQTLNAFADCENIENCNIEFDTDNTTEPSYAFYNVFQRCNNIINCKILGSVKYYPLHQLRGFYSCKNLVNCDVTISVASSVSNYVEAYESCSNLVNCSVATSGTGFSNVSYVSNCHANSGHSGTLLSGANTFVDAETVG